MQIGYSILVEPFPSRRAECAVAADDALPAASIVKLLIAIASIEVVAENAMVPVRTGAFGTPNRYLPPVAPGAHVPLKSLLKFMIEQSDNFSSNVLIAYLGMARINHAAEKLGLVRTRIHGTFIEGVAPLTPRGYTTARECNSMLFHILSEARGAAKGAAAYRELIGMMLAQSDRRFIPAALPRDLAIANKTGEIHGEINDSAIVDPFGASPTLFTILGHGPFNIYNTSHADYGDVVRAVRNRAGAAWGTAKAGSVS